MNGTDSNIAETSVSTHKNKVSFLAIFYYFCELLKTEQIHMKRILKLAIMWAMATFPILLPAQTKDKDTTIYNFSIKELSIISTPKETYLLRQLPSSTTILNSDILES